MNAALKSLSLVYGAVATWRRRRYLRDPDRRRHVHQPVISVGNLSVGGTGKTPIAASIARLLIAQGERPSILSRGYRRRLAPDGVTVVSDGRQRRATIDSSGDEPLMLARMLPTVPVLVGRDRYLAGRLAEEKMDVTIHVLDDGFQHLELARDIDLLVIREDNLKDQVLPAGRLREPLLAAAAADAAIVSVESQDAAERVASTLNVPTSFHVHRRLGEPWWFTSDDGAVAPGMRVVGVAGIAHPDAFFRDLAAAGWDVVDAVPFRDHHPFTIDDVRRIESAARSAGAVVMTTEKDAVRLEGCGLGRVPVAVVPLTVTVEPAARFAEWLAARIAEARARR
jgi:tetraacyldisaccharide 4'-kinase